MCQQLNHGPASASLIDRIQIYYIVGSDSVVNEETRDLCFTFIHGKRLSKLTC